MPNFPTKTPKIRLATATERMDLDNSDVNYYINQNPQNVFRPNLVPSVPDPTNSVPFSQLTPDRSNIIKQISPPVNGDKLMSPFLQAPGPPALSIQPRMPSVQWANQNGFVPSQLSSGMLTARLSNPEEISVMVTPMSKKPNTIPMTDR